jgi:non-ribosomal peptide synthetase component F
MSVSTPAPARVQDTPPASRALNEGRVLIADDEAGVRWRTGERLEHLFEQRVDALAAQGRADAIAVDGPKGPITYAELDARANQLARHLGLRVGVRAGDRVALLLERPTDAYVAMLAVLKLHAAYVPLDASFPADRVAYIVEDAGARLVITDAGCRDRLGELGSARFLRLDEQEVTIAGESAARLAAGEVPGPLDELCYAIYTSGTTGRSTSPVTDGSPASPPAAAAATCCRSSTTCRWAVAARARSSASSPLESSRTLCACRSRSTDTACRWR